MYIKRYNLSYLIEWKKVSNTNGEISLAISRNATDWIQRELSKKEGVLIYLSYD